MQKLLLASLGAAFIGCSASAMATQTDNHGMHAVPVPGKVAIDGDLADWDLSGQVIMCYDLEALRDIYSAQVATMYDDQNLFVSIHWKDPTPMGNSHDPLYQANKGWAGDCVQLRIKTDRISHVTAWYYGKKNEPALQIDYGKSLTEPFGGGGRVLARTEGWKLQGGAEMAFKKDADGKGYVQEIKIPWSLITNGKSFKPGDKLQCGVELLWGEADWPVHRYADNLAEGASSREFFFTAYPAWGDLKLEPQGKLKLPEPVYMVAYRQATQGEASQGPVDITYNLPKDARVTLAIEDKSGRRIRNLIAALPRTKGRNTDKWDGLDDNGKPVPPGDYTFKAIYHDGIHAKYALNFASPGNPGWETPDGRGGFYGDHTAAQAAASAGDFVALACPIGEAGKHLIATDLNGQRLWGLANRVFGNGGTVTLATDGKILWVGLEGTKATVYRVNIANGQYAPWNQTAKNAEGNEYKVLDLPVTEAPGISTNKELGANLTAIAVHGGRLAVSLKRENLVKILDAETGAVTSEIKVDAPQSVAFAPDGNLIVLSRGRLLRVAPDGAQSPFTAGTYAEGYGVTTDAAGQVYLTVRGADQNVKLFSPTGQLVREIGARGGRPANGPYNAQAMRNPGQPAIDSKGRLWVPEETMNPKRTSVWDVNTGQLVKDLAGTTTYAGAGAINPYDPTIGFSDDTVYKLDWEKGTYAPTYSLAQTAAENDLFPGSVHKLTSRVVKRGNYTYAFTGGAGRNLNDVHCTLWDGKNWRSAAHVGLVPGGAQPSGPYANAAFAGHANQFFAWTDKSGDGLVQPDELSFWAPQIDGKAAQVQNFYWGRLPDGEGTVAFLTKSPAALIKFSITGTTPGGAPIYDVTQPQIVKMDRDVLGGNGEGMLLGGANGRTYLNQDPLITVEKDGHVVGDYPNHNTSVHGSHSATASKPGYLIGPSSYLGVADLGGDIGEVYDLNGNLGENYIFTSDGLWVQSLFKDTRGYFESPTQAVRGMSMDLITGGGESFGGNFVRTPDGKVYLTIGGTDARVLEITGLDSIKRLNGKFTYNANQFAAAQKLAQEKAALANQPKLYAVARAAETPVIDGKATEWADLLDDSKPLLEIQESPRQRYARVQARYDNNNLYLGYRVFAPRNAMKNVGQDERLLFKTGDAVDLMLGPETSANGAGNLRLLLTVPKGNPIAVINQKVAPGAPAAEKYAFSSPWRTITFDRVATLNNVPVATGPISGGYFVETAIPWSVLGVKPQPGLKLKADVGALFADNGGTTTVSRQYWSNKATGLVNDVPGEADLTPNLWGTFTLE